MSNIVDIDAKRPHKTGYVFCGFCGHHWIGVAPVGHDPLECPKCRYARGEFAADLVLEASQSIEELPPSDAATKAVVAVGELGRFVRALNGQ